MDCSHPRDPKAHVPGKERQRWPRVPGTFLQLLLGERTLPGEAFKQHFKGVYHLGDSGNTGRGNGKMCRQGHYPGSQMSGLQYASSETLGKQPDLCATRENLINSAISQHVHHALQPLCKFRGGGRFRGEDIRGAGVGEPLRPTTTTVAPSAGRSALLMFQIRL